MYRKEIFTTDKENDKREIRMIETILFRYTRQTLEKKWCMDRNSMRFFV